MATRHVMQAERRDVTTTPSHKTLKRKLKVAETLGDFEMKPGYLYTVVRAISARVNQNYDGWPSDELQKAAHTFIGKPVFVNHENYDPKKARGVIVAARYVEAGADKYIEVIQEVDANRFPKLAHEIKTGGLDSVSMGAEAGFTICSYCGNKAQDVPDMCDHVLFHKGEKLSRRNKKTGKREEVLVYESCHKLSFFELSYVFEPADETAVASKVLVAAKRHIHSAECAPGDSSCNSNVQDTSAPVSGMAGFGNPKNTAETSSGGGASATPASSSTSSGASSEATTVGGGEVGKPDADGVLPSSRGLYDTVKTYNPDIGTYRVDDFHEHDHGALDVMTSDPAIADRVKSDAFAAGSPYVLWQQTQWNADGSSSKMDDRGDPTQNHMDHVHTAPIGGKNALFERKVLRTAGFKLADACHYCKNDAEDGFKSCGAHRAMEDNKFKAAVMASFHMADAIPAVENGDDDKVIPDDFVSHFYGEPAPSRKMGPHYMDLMYAKRIHAGPPPQPTNHTGIQSQPGMQPKDYVAPFQGRGYKPGTPVDVYRNLHADVRKQGMWSIKQGNHVIGHSDFVHMPNGQFFVNQKGQERVLDTQKKEVHAGARGVLSEVPPDDHGPYTGITYNPKAGDTSFIQRESREPVHTADHVHLGPDGKAYAVNPRSNAQSFEARVIRAVYGDGEMMSEGDQFHNLGDGHGLHVFPPREGVPGIAGVMPDKPGNPHYEWVHSHHGEPINQGFAPTPEEAHRAGRASMDAENAAQSFGSWDPNFDKHDPRFAKRVLRAYGETEAPAQVDTLREEGSAPEDDNNDFYHYVEPPKELQTPDLSQATQIDREQDQNGQAGMDGAPGPYSADSEMGGASGAPPGPQQQFMELKIPIPAQGQAGAPGGSQIPMQPYAAPPAAPAPPAPAGPPAAPAGPPQPPQQIAASTLSYMDRYFNRRVSREAMNLSSL